MGSQTPCPALRGLKLPQLFQPIRAIDVTDPLPRFEGIETLKLVILGQPQQVFLGSALEPFVLEDRGRMRVARIFATRNGHRPLAPL